MNERERLEQLAKQKHSERQTIKQAADQRSAQAAETKRLEEEKDRRLETAAITEFKTIFQGFKFPGTNHEIKVEWMNYGIGLCVAVPGRQSTMCFLRIELEKGFYKDRTRQKTFNLLDQVKEYAINYVAELDIEAQLRGHMHA